MKTRRVLRFLFVIISAFIILTIFLIVLIFITLPTPTEINKQLNFSENNINPQPSFRKTEPVKLQETSPTVESKIDVDSEKKEFTHNNATPKLIIEVLSDKNTPLSNVCESLTNINTKQRSKLTTKEFNQRFNKSLFNKTSDPLVKSLIPVLKLALTQPMMQTLVMQLQDSTTHNDHALKNKIEFYQSAYHAYKEMIENKENMQRILDQSYLTMMLGRVIEINPSLINDPRITHYCEDIESALNENSMNRFDMEKNSFIEFLNDINVSPDSIGFDINYQTQLDIGLDDTGLRFKGGWLDQIFVD